MIAQARIPAAAYIRVSSGPQAKGLSPELQEQAMRGYAAEHGLDIALQTSDVQKGRVISRTGYQEVLQAARAGVVHVVLTYRFDRWGRDSVEWVSRARELDRFGVSLISVQEGRDEGGFMRGIRALLAEEESRTIARRTRPAKEEAVRRGQHIGATPVGLKRHYPEREGSGRYIPGLLVPDEPAASTIRELFRRAAAGVPCSSLAIWMNAQSACPRTPRGKPWDKSSVRYVLHNPVYCGRIRYNAKPCGFYDRCKPGDAFVVPGRHEGLVSAELFDQVQARLQAARTPASRSRLARPLPIGAGLFFCAECGGPMTISRRRTAQAGDQYVCRNHRLGVKPCTSRAYLCQVAHAGLLAQIARLQGHKWEPQALEPVLAADPAHEERAQLEAELRGVTLELERHIKRFSALVEDPTPQEIAAHRAVGKELSARIASLEATLAALPAASVDVVDLRTVHRELARCELGDLVRIHAAAGDEIALRELVTGLIERAVVAERVPALRSRWTRVEVVWSRNVQLLLAAGLLTLGPDMERPSYPSDPRELQHERYLRYYARKKAGLLPTTDS